MHIIVVGCGRTGSLLARTLAGRGHQVVVIDPNPEQFSRLGPNFRGRTITGIGFDRDVLLRAGIEHAHGVAAVTSDEMANLLVAFIARHHFKVPNVVARLFEPERAALYQAIGVPVVTAAEWRVHRLEQLLCQPALNVMDTLGNGEITIVEVRVPPAWAGRPFSSFFIPEKVVPTVLIRGGSARIPAPDTPMEAGDIVRISVATDALEELRNQILQAGGLECAS
ncbi:MAG: TrkA family potassium uptake protein [Anaerolineae bacterium]|nr:TrkA family potassium uptake protein [Anaerolineae bacterium]MCX8067090.1 TrkA family potassium uptake protein [Anaerolineae bacterium]MDW7992066.1 TrkA family potassium uptake protein [Anaerolineae bacterium]